MQKVAGVVRSTRADYNLPNKTKTELYLAVFCETSAGILRRYSAVLETLATCSKVVVTDKPPTGCAIVTVSDKVSSFRKVLVVLRVTKSCRIELA